MRALSDIVQSCGQMSALLRTPLVVLHERSCEPLFRGDVTGRFLPVLEKKTLPKLLVEREVTGLPHRSPRRSWADTFFCLRVRDASKEPSRVFFKGRALPFGEVGNRDLA